MKSGFFSTLLTVALPFASSAMAADVEKPDLVFGFIKLTDMAPLAVALENGYFADEGLNVTLKAMPNWTAVSEGVADGSLDGSHMLAGQPLAGRIGIGVQANFVTPLSMDLNGNGITVSNDLWAQIAGIVPRDDYGRPKHPISASVLKDVAAKMKAEGKPLQMGMVYPVSTHNYELRYWLAAGGLNPGMYKAEDLTGITGGTENADVELSVTPPPKMPETMASGAIAGYCVGEPWNQEALFRGVGVPVISDHQIWKNNPEKVFGMTEEFISANPKTTVAIVKAMIRAAKWLDDGGTFNRPEAADMLARPEYVGADANVIINSMTGTFEFEPGDKRIIPEFNTFFADYATYPYYSDAIWYLTQMRRWGQITEAKSAEWYHDIAKATYRPDIYMEAAKALISEGHLTEDEVPAGTDGYRAPTAEFIDGVEYDGHDPLGYLSRMAIGNTN
ncbi:CmpA/NrtA family ABC transporter substrate-binding protein [Sedimentimonas flavescens]|uniref:CmpA/NrtA family ABC transporter substrate-binding protein n=1 Tax=Sedimentimonas flavescens TaxID=2851012 RepID=UPI001C4A1CAF|nr:ABC transporter substrate-binding protein [Sedimentimonas flavescens]